MIYLLSKYILSNIEALSFFRIVNYVSFRSLAAAVTSFLLIILFGRRVINLLFRRGMRDSIRDYGNLSSQSKEGTPTMGGIIVIGAVLISTFLWNDPTNRFMHYSIAALLWFGFLGAIDDVKKAKQGEGVSQGVKLLLQLLFAAGFGLLYLGPGALPLGDVAATELCLPFFKNPVADIGLLYFPFILFVILAISNSVNFADGLDGLAVVPVAMTTAVYGVFAYIIGNRIHAESLLFPHFVGTSELMILASGTAGACIGFLWWNSYPAQVFLGDAGSQALGALLAMFAILLKQEFLFLICGGIFVAEGASVLIQEKIGINRLGRRIFYRAPLHHTFQHVGLAETKVVVRFWIISLILALLALGTLKIR